MVAMLWFSLERTPMQLGLLRQGDWPGIVTMAIGLAACRRCWKRATRTTGSARPSSCGLSVVAAVSLAAFFYDRADGRARPLLNLRLLKRRNFGFGMFANLLLGVALYGSVFILPLYMSRIQGYNSEQIGFVLAWTGIPQLFLIPLVPRLMKRFDPRRVIAVGFLLFAASNFMNVHLTSDSGASELLLPNLVRAIGQALAFTPLSALATADIEPENAGSASALFNMMRNLGGAIAIASLQTFQIKREQFHSNVLVSRISILQDATRQRIEQLTQYFMAHGVADSATAGHKAVVAIATRVRQQANVVAFSDTFYLLGIGLLLALLVTLLLEKPRHTLSGGGGH